MLDGVVIDLLKTKWDTFVKSRFYKQFYMFSFYFLFSLASFILRPGPINKQHGDENRVTTTDINNASYYTQSSSTIPIILENKLSYSKIRFPKYIKTIYTS